MKTGIALDPKTDQGRESQNTVRFACPQCGQHIECDIRGAGQIVECPTCKATFAAPNPANTNAANSA